MILLRNSDVGRIERSIESALSNDLGGNAPADDIPGSLLPLEYGLNSIIGKSGNVQRLFSALAALSDGVAVCNLSGLLLFKNPALSEMLAGCAGSDRLLAELAEIVTALATAPGGPSNTADPDKTEVIRSFDLQNRRLRLTGCLLPSQLHGGDSVALVVVRETTIPDLNALSPTRLFANFNLTEREAQVALLLAERRSNSEIATRLGLSAHTARHHTERVLRKLNVESRNAVANFIYPARPRSPG